MLFANFQMPTINKQLRSVFKVCYAYFVPLCHELKIKLAKQLGVHKISVKQKH